MTETVNGASFKTYTLQHSYLGQLLDQNGTGSASGSSHEVYTYDGRGRLSAEGVTYTPPVGSPVTTSGSYGYDLANNLQAVTGGWSVNVNNQLTSAPAFGGLPGGSGLGYDASGNLTGMNGATLGYDGWGRLTSITGLPVGNIAYSYDPAGRRLSKTVAGVTTYYVYAGERLLGELNASGQLTVFYTWGTGGLVADRTGGQSSLYLFDGEGSARNRLNDSTGVMTDCAYTAWGARVAGSLSATAAFGWKGQYGQYLDSESGLIHCGVRYYAPAIGRFVSRDPIGFLGGINLYAFAADDPVNFADPSGLLFKGEGLAFRAGTSEAAAAGAGESLGVCPVVLLAAATAVISYKIGEPIGNALANTLYGEGGIWAGPTELPADPLPFHPGSPAPLGETPQVGPTQTPKKKKRKPETIMRLVGDEEASLSTNGFIISNNTGIGGMGTGKSTQSTRVFEPDRLDKMLKEPIMAGSEYTHLIAAKVRPEWRQFDGFGGARLGSDGWGHTVAVPEINSFLVGPLVITPRPKP